MPELVNLKDFAVAAGVSKPMVTKYRQSGLPMEGGKVRLADGLKWLKDNGLAREKRSNAGGRPKAGTQKAAAAAVREPGRTDRIETKADADRRDKIAVANLREIEEAQRRGDMVPLAAINAHIAGMIIYSRDILYRLPGEMGDRLAKESDPVRVREMLTTEVERSLNGLAEYSPNA